MREMRALGEEITCTVVNRAEPFQPELDALLCVMHSGT